MTELLKGTFFINGREKDYKWSFYMKLYRNWQKKVYSWSESKIDFYS